MILPLATNLVIALVGTWWSPQGSDTPAGRLVAMRQFADGVTMEQTSQATRQVLERLPEPAYRFADPARHTTDGTVWIWGRSGRPSAVMTLTKHRPPDRDEHWLSELTSLTPGSLSASIEGIGNWQPSGVGVVMKEFPKTPTPADDAPKRLRQMKDLVRQIKAHETSRPRTNPPDRPPNRFELRVLPQPVHRYSDVKSGLVDGGLFLIAYGLNPELVMLVEARREGSLQPAWYYGIARISVMDVQVDFAGKELWSDRRPQSAGRNDRYFLFTRPIVDE